MKKPKTEDGAFFPIVDVNRDRPDSVFIWIILLCAVQNAGIYIAPTLPAPSVLIIEGCSNWRKRSRLSSI